MPPRKPARLTAMHYQHLGLGARMLDDDGWQRPACYTSKEEELPRLRQRGGICDISPNGKLMLKGAGINTLLASAFPRVGPPEVGRVARGASQDQPGFSVGPALLCRLSDDEALVVTPPAEARPVADHLAGHLAGCVHLVDVSSGLAGIKVVGPPSNPLLSKLTELDLNAARFTDLSCAEAKLADLYAVVVRCDVAGQPSYDVYVERSYGTFLWDAMLEAGHELDVGPIGVEALELLEAEGR